MHSVITLKDDGWSTRSRANPIGLSSLKGKVKNVTKNINIHCESKNWTIFHLSITFANIVDFNKSFTVADRNYLTTNT